jgi:hypothetical protein
MKEQGSLTKTIEYGRKLVHAGVCGMEAGERSELDGRALSPFLLDSARDSLAVAAAAAFAGLLGCQLLRRRVHPLKIATCGALAFAAGFSWKTRKVGASATHAALKEVAKVRDEHWLELHPVDYA